MHTLIARWGNGLGLRIPRDIARQAGLSEGSAVDITAGDGCIVIRPDRRRYTLDQLLAGVTPEEMHEAFAWGPDVGGENVP